MQMHIACLRKCTPKVDCGGMSKNKNQNKGRKIKDNSFIGDFYALFSKVNQL